MAESFIQLPQDSTGKKVRSFSNTVGPNDVHSQASTITDAAGNLMNNLVSGRLDVILGASSITLPVSAASLPLPAGAATSALQTTGNTTLTTISGRLGTLGQKVMTGSAPVVIASDQSAVPVTTTRPGTSALANVATSTGSAQLLAANTARRGATVYNDSNQNLFVKLGTTASTTSFTIRMSAQSYYEVPNEYTGRIDAIHSTGTGTARVTELT